MLEEARHRTQVFQSRLKEAGIGLALISDESSIAYLAGFWGYLSVEFGRPTFLLVPAEGEPTVLTPLLESEMVSAMTWVDDVASWEDAGPRRWEALLKGFLGTGLSEIGIEAAALPAIVRIWFDAEFPGTRLRDIGRIIQGMRMIKSAGEIEVMRKTGAIAAAMMAAAEGALAEGVPEFEAALAVIAAGTRTAASFLTPEGRDVFVSPMIHDLQIMQSGRHTSMVHRRASVKRLERGDPVYFCLCNSAQFRHYRLGFDRMFFLGEASAEAARVQQAAIDAQQAAIAAIGPGVTAESVAKAANAVYRAQGYETGYRAGRSIGMSHLEPPELKLGDTTILRPGMTFAVDGGISVHGRLGGRIGDSVVVTENGCDFLTDYPRQIAVVGG